MPSSRPCAGPDSFGVPDEEGSADPKEGMLDELVEERNPRRKHR